MSDRYHFSMLLAFLFLSRLSLGQEFSTPEPMKVAAVNYKASAQGADSVKSAPAIGKPVPAAAFEFSVYPNPAHSVVYVRLPLVPQEITWIRLLNSEGKILKEQEVPVLPKSFAYSLPEGLASGKYQLEIQSLSGFSRAPITVCGY